MATGCRGSGQISDLRRAFIVYFIVTDDIAVASDMSIEVSNWIKNHIYTYTFVCDVGCLTPNLDGVALLE